MYYVFGNKTNSQGQEVTGILCKDGVLRTASCDPYHLASWATESGALRAIKRHRAAEERSAAVWAAAGRKLNRVGALWVECR